MKRYASLALGLAVAGCASNGSLTPAAQQTVDKVLASQPGALFCALQLAGGGTIFTTVLDSAAAAALPGAAPLVVLAAGMVQSQVMDDCTAAAKATGAVAGVPVSPPASGTVVAPVAIPGAVAAKPAS